MQIIQNKFLNEEIKTRNLQSEWLIYHWLKINVIIIITIIAQTYKIIHRHYYRISLRSNIVLTSKLYRIKEI